MKGFKKIIKFLSVTAVVVLLSFVFKNNIAFAAITYVGGATATGNSASFNVSLTALTGGSNASPSTGDVVVVLDGFTSSANGNPGVTTAGFTELTVSGADLYSNGSTYDANLSVSYKVMTATPDTTIACNGSGSASNGAVCIVQVWRGVDTTTPIDVTTIGATGSGNNNFPNSAAITPFTDNALVITAVLEAAANPTAGTAPSGYTNATQITVDPSAAAQGGMASKLKTPVGSEDPGAWSGFTTASSASWAAYTIALRPALSVSGTANGNNGSTVKVAVNNTVQTQTATISGGAWTISGISGIAANSVITAFVDNVADASESTAVTKMPSTSLSDVTGMVLNTNVVTIGSNQNTSVSATNLDQYDCGADEDVMYVVTSGALNTQGSSCAGSTTNSYTADTLSVLSGNTFTMDSASTESLSTDFITNAGTITATGSPSITLAGTSGTLLTNTGTFNAATSTVNVTGAGTTTLLSAAQTLSDLTINNASAVVTAGADLTIGDVFTITAGSFNPGTSNLTVIAATSISGTFNDTSATGSNLFIGAVTVNNGGTWGTNAANSGYTFQGGLTVNSTSTFTSGNGTYSFTNNQQTIGGTQSFSITNLSSGVTTGSGLTFSGSSPTITSLSQTADAILTFSGTVPTITSLSAFTSGNIVQFTSTGAQTIPAKTYNNVVVNKTAGTATFGGTITVGTAFTLTQGTIDANNNNISTGSFSSANTNTRAITMGSGTWTLTGTGAVWDTSTATNLTITPGTSTIKVTDTSATAKIFSGGGKTYNNIWYAPTAGTGNFEVTGDNIFNDFQDTGTASHSLLFNAGSNTTVTTFTVTGDATHTVTITSGNGSGAVSTATHTLTKAGGGTISSDYLNIQHSIAAPSSTWYAGTHSTDNNSVATAGSGWTFTAPASDGTPYGGTAWTIPGTIQAEDFNNGGEGVAYHDNETANQGNQYRTGEGVDIETSSDTGGGYDIGWVASGEWLKYTINVQTTDTYTFYARVAGFSTAAIDILIDGSSVGTVNTTSTGGFQTWQTVSVGGISLTAGTHVLRLNLTTTDNLNYFTLTNNLSPTANAGTDQSISLPTTTTTLSGSGSDSDGTIASYAWSFISGPVTPTITSASSASTGVTGLSSTGTYVFRLTVTDNGGATGTDDINVVVSPDQSTKIYYVDFGLSTNQTSVTGWNNLSDMTTSGPTLTLVDSSGTTSARTLHVTDSFYYNNGLGMDSSVNQNGTSSSTLYPASATGDSFFLGTLNAITDTSAAITLAGLNDNNTYDFKFYASRVAGDSGNRTTDYTVGVTTVSLNATDNVNNFVQITAVSPSAGSIVISINKNAAATFGYIGVLEITEHVAANSAPTANAGVDQSVTMPVSSVTLSGSGSDSDGTIASYSWSEISSNYATINSPSSATTTVKDLAAGTYTFRLTVTDNQGATGTDDMVVTVANHSLTTPTAKTVVVLGSSTSAGYGLTPSSDAYVNRFATYFDGLVASNSVVNLAVSGYTTYQILPTGTNNGARPAVDTAHNITQALTYSPAAILVNMPSNDTANGYAVSEQETNFQLLASTAASAGVPIYFTTTQPRNNFTAGQVTDQTTVRDWILSTYGTNAIDFWTTFAQADGTIDPIYDQGDGIHLNNVAHKKLYARVAESTLINVAHNLAPTANAGVDQSISTTITTLSGSGSDTDGSIASYAWSFISGPVTPTIASPSAASTSVSGMSSAGTYVFRLTVTDNLGKTGTDDINVVTTASVTGCSSQVASGNWNTTGTWDCGHVPSNADNVTIMSGHTITMDVASNSLGTLTVNGTLTTAGYALTASTMSIASGATVNANSSTITLTGTGTPFSNSGTFNAGTSTIKLTDTSATAKTFSGGNGTYGILWLSPTTGTPTYTIAGNNTFNEFKDSGTAAHTIKFTTGSTQTITTWTVQGTSGNRITIDSTTTGTHTLVKVGSQVRTDYLNIQHSIATPSNTWYAGINSVNNQGVASAGSGWIFQTVTLHNGSGGGTAAGGETSTVSGTGTCADGIQNGNETGIDTGGRCAPATSSSGGGGSAGGETNNTSGTGTCADGIQNGNETGIDTGGRCAPANGSGGGGGDSGFRFDPNRYLAYIIGLMQHIFS